MPMASNFTGTLAGNEDAERGNLIPSNAAGAVAAEREKNRRQQMYERRCDMALRCGQGFVIVAGGIVLIVVLVLVGIGLSKVNHAVDNLSGSSMQAKLNRVLDHAMNAAKNTEAATLNALSASEAATDVVQQVHPKVMDALNTSSEIMHELKTFSFNPKWTISAG